MPVPPDLVNDPIPTNVTVPTQERMRGLVTMTKDLTSKLEAVTALHAEHMDIVRGTGVTVEGYGHALQIMKLFNSTDPAENEQALTALLGQVKYLTDKLGKPMPGIDPLTGHADLIGEVNANTLTRARAEEIALTRNRDKHATAVNEGTAARDRAEQEFNTALTTARAGMNAWGTAKQASDPHYLAKKDQLLPIMKPVLQELHPSKWQAAWEKAYNALPNPAVAAIQPLRQVVQPLRPRAPAGGTAVPAASAEDAMAAALGSSVVG